MNALYVGDMCLTKLIEIWPLLLIGKKLCEFLLKCFVKYTNKLLKLEISFFKTFLLHIQFFNSHRVIEFSISSWFYFVVCDFREKIAVSWEIYANLFIIFPYYYVYKIISVMSGSVSSLYQQFIFSSLLIFSVNLEISQFYHFLKIKNWVFCSIKIFSPVFLLSVSLVSDATCIAPLFCLWVCSLCFSTYSWRELEPPSFFPS